MDKLKQTKAGVCAPQGFSATGMHAGFRKNRDKKDFALIVSDVPCVAAGVTTQNLSCAAPVLVTKKHLQSGVARAIICNSGNANACTSNGMEIAQNTCKLAAEALHISEDDVLVASTGVIGQDLQMKPIENGIKPLVQGLDRSAKASDDCANAIMTTDLIKKEIAGTVIIAGKEVTIGGICKGSGMIHPNMATMLAFFTTDAKITVQLLQKAVKDATELSFNMVSVDGDTSTNDMVLVLANGMAENDCIEAEDENYLVFYNALLEVFTKLAIAVAADGEGASKLICCKVSGANDENTAKILARGIIKSSLVKAAIFGADANWGRVICAMGYSGAKFVREKVDIYFASTKGKVQVCENGVGLQFDEALALDILKEKEVEIHAQIAEGECCATAWGCDLTYDYVRINGEYRS